MVLLTSSEPLNLERGLGLLFINFLHNVIEDLVYIFTGDGRCFKEWHGARISEVSAVLVRYSALFYEIDLIADEDAHNIWLAILVNYGQLCR